MQIKVEEREPRAFVVVLAGELDMATSPMLAEAVAEVLDRGPVETVVVELSELGFLDSSGMRALLQARNATAEHGARFAVRHPSGQVAQVLRIAALDQVLNVDEEDSTSPA